MSFNRYNTIYSPCFKCTERITSCHSKCIKYYKYKKEMERIKKARYESRDELILIQDRNIRIKNIIK